MYENERFDSAEEGLDPSRIIHKRGMQKKINRQSGSKLVGIGDTESVNESLTMIAGHVDYRVSRIYPQPFTFDLNTGEAYDRKDTLIEEFRGTGYKPWIYTPDFLFQLIDGREVVVETKHERWLSDNPGFYDVIKSVDDHGYEIILVTDRMFTHAFSHNIRKLKLAQDHRDEGTAAPEVSAEMLPATGHTLASELRFTQSDVFHALLDNRLTTDLQIAIGWNSHFSAPSTDAPGMEVLPL